MGTCAVYVCVVLERELVSVGSPVDPTEDPASLPSQRPHVLRRR